MTGPFTIGQLVELERASTRGIAQVMRNHGTGRPVLLEASGLHHDGALAKLLNGCHIVADEYDRPSLARDGVHSPETLLLELHVSHHQHRVYDHDLLIAMRRDRKCKAYGHATRISLDGRIDKHLDAREIDDFVKL